MKNFLIKLLGYRECNKCHKIFELSGGQVIPIVSVKHRYREPDVVIERMFFCSEDKRDFDFALNSLNVVGEPIDRTVLCKLESQGFSNWYPNIVPQRK